MLSPPEDSMAQKGSLKRKVVGAGVLGLVALGIWFGQFLGFGLGKGSGSGTGSSESTGESEETTTDRRSSSSSPSATVVSHQTTGRSAVEAPERLRVIIDGDHFILASGDSGSDGQTL